jgi:acetyl-CoA C-acetyltransferase
LQQASRPQGPAVVITHAVRTPIGKFMGSLSELSSADLGVHAVKGLLARSGLDPAQVGEVLVGNGRQAGGGPNVARQISVRSGVPVTTPAWTVNMACGSGLKALLLVADSIRLGPHEVGIAAGTESMSRLPFMLPDFRKGYRLGHAAGGRRHVQGRLRVSARQHGDGRDGGEARADLGISRDEQDQFALSSQHKSQAARQKGLFADEIAAVELAGKKGTTLFAARRARARRRDDRRPGQAAAGVRASRAR